MNKFEGYLLFRKFSIIQRYSQIFVTQHLKENNVSRCHAPILMTIYLKEGLTQNELAEHLKFNKGAVAKLVKAIEHEGYITRRNDDNDRRLQRLYLADKGHKVIPEIKQLEADLSEQMMEGFSDSEKRVLHNMLNRIIENISSK